MLLKPFTTKRSSQSGFSILEVLVTAAIIGIITAIIVLRYGAFNNAVLLRSQAYELALDLREIQIFSVSSRGREAETFREEYGINFTTGSPNIYQLFRDRAVNGDVKPAIFQSNEALGEPYTIDARFAISRICINLCRDGVDDVSNLAVTFKRPDFDAKFSSSNVANNSSINFARVEITSIADPTDPGRAVEVYGSGQINVE